MSNFKYNVGDKVIDLSSLSLWDNSMYFSKFEDHFVKTVTSATEKHFSVSRYDVTLPMNYDTHNDQYIFNQEDGSCRDYAHTIDNRLYHFVHDNARVVAFIKKKMAEAFAVAEAADTKEIASLEAQIRSLQARIDKIKAGGREATFGKVPQREFLETRQHNILSKLEL